MHYCSDEVSNHTSTRWDSPSHTSVDLGSPNQTQEADDLYAELEDSLNDLEEGLDVLMVLEHAYERAIKAHVTPIVNFGSQDQGSTSLSHVVPPSSSPESIHRPLNAGSSTALLAILHQEHVHLSPSLHNRSSPRSGPSHSDRVPEETLPRAKRSDAVITIANLGDSMAMLVRGRDIVWRSEEMWWSFNTPVQLGPVSPSSPRDAQVFKLPVQADDILILASDGLSDNLWDEEILEEVIRVREVLLRHRHPWGLEEPFANNYSSVLGRKSLAGMLSEALCSRARRVAEKGPNSVQAEVIGLERDPCGDEVPFARRAREEGKKFKGGKVDGQPLSS
jgi:Stage II sporulation protein E (SpoIIE)